MCIRLYSVMYPLYAHKHSSIHSSAHAQKAKINENKVLNVVLTDGLVIQCIEITNSILHRGSLDTIHTEVLKSQ